VTPEADVWVSSKSKNISQKCVAGSLLGKDPFDPAAKVVWHMKIYLDHNERVRRRVRFKL
jgi:hypothetical protein